MAPERDVDLERRLDRAARRAEVAQNQARGVTVNLREALALIAAGERLHATVARE